MRAHSNAPTYCGNLWQKWLVHFPLRDMSIDQPGPGRTWWFLSIAPIAAGLPAILTHQTIPAILRCTQTHNVIFMQGGIPARRRVAFASTGLCIIHMGAKSDSCSGKSDARRSCGVSRISCPSLQATHGPENAASDHLWGVFGSGWSPVATAVAPVGRASKYMSKKMS